MCGSFHRVLSLFSSGMVDLSQLCINAGTAVWLLKVDVVCLEYDGNIRDAALLAVVAALRNTRLPVPTLQEDGDVTVHPTDTRPLVIDIDRVPVPTTVAVVDDVVCVDPTMEEEALAVTSLTAVVLPNGKVCMCVCVRVKYASHFAASGLCA